MIFGSGVARLQIGQVISVAHDQRQAAAFALQFKMAQGGPACQAGRFPRV